MLKIGPVRLILPLFVSSLLFISACISTRHYYECAKEEAEIELTLNYKINALGIKGNQTFYLKELPSEKFSTSSFGHALHADDGEKVRSYGITLDLNPLDKDEFEITISGYAWDYNDRKIEFNETILAKMNTNTSDSSGVVSYRIQWRNVRNVK